MKKTGKKILSLFLAIVMAVTACSVGFTAFAKDTTDDTFTYITSEGNEVEITYEQLNIMLNTYAPTIIEAVVGLLDGLGVKANIDMDAVNSSEKPIYELMSQLSPMLIGLLGGSSAEASDVIDGYLPIDDTHYSYIQSNEDDAMSFWTLYEFCNSNLSSTDKNVKDYCEKALDTLNPILNLYSNVKTDYNNSLNAAINELTTIFGVNDEGMAGGTIKSDSAPEGMVLDGDNLAVASKETIGDVKAISGSSKGIAMKDLPTTVDDVDLAPFISYMEAILKSIKAIDESEQLSLTDAIYYYFNTSVTTIGVNAYLATAQEGNTIDIVASFGTSDLTIHHGEYYYDRITTDPNGFTYQAFIDGMANMFVGGMSDEDAQKFLTDNQKYLKGTYEYLAYNMAYEQISYENGSERSDTFYNELSQFMTETGYFNDVDAVNKDRESYAITDAEFLILKDYASIKNTNLTDFRTNVMMDEKLNGAIKYYINADFDNFADLQKDLTKWDPTVDSKKTWTAIMNSIADGVLSRYATYKFNKVYNGYDFYTYKKDGNNTPGYGTYVNSTFNSAIASFSIPKNYINEMVYKNVIEVKINDTIKAAEVTDKEGNITNPLKYSWDSVKPSGKIGISIVNALINGYVNDYLDPESTKIGEMIQSVLNKLLTTQDINLSASLKDIYSRLANNPVQTIFELLPLLTALLDEVIEPMIFNGGETTPGADNADQYFNEGTGFLYSLLCNASSDGILADKTQEAGSEIGLGALRFDLNTLVPTLLHWVTGDNDYTYTYYNVEKVDAGVDEDGNPKYTYIYNTPTTGANGTKWIPDTEDSTKVKRNLDDNDEPLVPVITNIYVADKALANAAICDIENDGLAEIVTELASFFITPIDEFVTNHGNDVKSYDGTTPSNKGLNNLFVALPQILNNAGQSFTDKYGIHSSWTFIDGTDSNIIKNTDDTSKANGCYYNAQLQAFKDLAKNPDAKEVLESFVDTFINRWLNPVVDLLNSTISDENNAITSNIPIITSVLNAIGGFGEKSVITDALNGLFGMDRNDLCSFTLKEQDNGYVGFSTHSAYFLITNVGNIITVVMDIVNASKKKSLSTSTTNVSLKSTAPVAVLVKSSNLYDGKISNANIKAAEGLIDELDKLLSSLLSNSSINGFNLNTTDGILSGAVTLVSNYIGTDSTNELIALLDDYLTAITADNVAEKGKVNANKVYTEKNLSNLVVRTYALLEKILDNLITINGDDKKVINGAIKGILSPSAVYIHSNDVLDEDLQDKVTWQDVDATKNLGYSFSAGDKKAFYQGLSDSLGVITPLLGVLLCDTGYYKDVFQPILQSICTACGVSSKCKLDTTETTWFVDILTPISAVLEKFYKAPVTTLINTLSGIAGVLDDANVKSIVLAAVSPITKEIYGLSRILSEDVSNLSPTYAGTIADVASGIDKKVNDLVSGKDIIVTAINGLTASIGVKLPTIDWKKLAKASAAEAFLLILSYGIDLVLDNKLLQQLLGDENTGIIKMMNKLDSSDVLNALTQILSITKDPTEVYWTFENYLGKATNTFTYPSGITASDADDAVDQLDDLVANIFPLLQGFGVIDQDNLSGVVSDLLFTNDMLTKLTKALYGALGSNETVAKVLDGAGIASSPKGLATYLTDKSYGKTYSSAAATLSKASNWNKVGSVNWGFTDGSAKAETGFMNALVAILRPFNDVLAVFLAEGDLSYGEILGNLITTLSLNGKTSFAISDSTATLAYKLKGGVLTLDVSSDMKDQKTSTIKLDLRDVAKQLKDGALKGTNGYESAIVPLLEAFMCDDVRTYKEYVSDYKNAKDNLLIDVLKPLFGFVDDVLANPIDTVTSVLPNVAYFIQNNGIAQLLNNLLAPVTVGVIGALTDNGINIDTILKSVLGKSLGDVITDALGIKATFTLNLTDLNSCNIQDIVVPLLNKLLKSTGIKLPSFKWSTIASLGTIATVKSAARNDDGKFTTKRVTANQGQVLVAVLRYVSQTLITNATTIKNLVCSIDAVSKNAKIKAIVATVFNQISTASKDQIVKAIFYLLMQEPENAFFDYTGFTSKDKDYDFAYPTTVDVDFLKVIGPMLDGLVGGLIDGGLNSLVSKNVYTNSIVSSLAVGLYKAVEGVKISDNLNLTELLAMTDIDFSTSNVAALLTNKEYGKEYASAAAKIKSAGSWSKVNKDSLDWGVTDRDSFLHALCAVLRPVYGVLDVLLNDGSLGLFKLIYLPGSDGYTSFMVPLMEAFGLYNIKTQYQYREDISKEYDNILLDILNPLMDKVEDLLNAPIEMLCDILPNLSLFFANGGLVQLVENLITPVSALLDAMKPIVDVNKVLKAAGLDIDKLINGLNLGVNFHFDIYDIGGSLGSIIDPENIVGLLNNVLKMIKIKGSALGIELMPIDWFQLASHGTVVMDQASQAATLGSRMYVQADQSEVLIAVLRYLINTINYKNNFQTINDLIAGLLGNVSDSVSDVIAQVLGMLSGDSDEVISQLCELLQTLA